MSASGRKGAIALLALLWVVAGACERSAPATSRDLAIDLRAYMKQLQSWEPLEKGVFEALSDVERTYYVDDDFVVRRFKAALPDVHRHIQELAAYDARTEDLKQVHQRYRDGWQQLQQGFEAVIAAMEAHDYQRLATAKNQVEGARRKMLEAFGQLDSMLADVEPELRQLRRPGPDDGKPS